MVVDVSLNGESNHFEGSGSNGFRVQSPAQISQRRAVLKFGGTVCGRLPIEVANICLCAVATSV